MSNKAKVLFGKTAVVIGASGEYGAATAGMLARGGANLVLAGRNRDRLERLEAELSTSGVDVLIVSADVTKCGDVDWLVEAALKHFGRLDILVYMVRASTTMSETLEIEDWERSLSVNVAGLLHCVAAILPTMEARNSGHILAIDCDGDRHADMPYDAGRGAVYAVMSKLGDEVSVDRIRTSIVRLDRSAQPTPEGCAEVVRHSLVGESRPGFSIYLTPGTADMSQEIESSECGSGLDIAFLDPAFFLKDPDCME